MKLNSQQLGKLAAGFTMIELLVSISIFAFMTAFLVSKYGTFNQSVLLTNLAYDTALTVRSAQTFGLNVQGTATSSPSILGFNYAYGVHFDPAKPTQFILFVDLCGTNKFETGTTCSNNALLTLGATAEIQSTYSFRQGFTIKSVCAGAGSGNNCTAIVGPYALDILFKRPNPDAIIQNTTTGATNPGQYAKVVMTATDGSMKAIVVQSTGQIAVTN